MHTYMYLVILYLLHDSITCSVIWYFALPRKSLSPLLMAILGLERAARASAHHSGQRQDSPAVKHNV